MHVSRITGAPEVSLVPLLTLCEPHIGPVDLLFHREQKTCEFWNIEWPNPSPRACSDDCLVSCNKAECKKPFVAGLDSHVSVYILQTKVWFHVLRFGFQSQSRQACRNTTARRKPWLTMVMIPPPPRTILLLWFLLPVWARTWRPWGSAAPRAAAAAITGITINRRHGCFGESGAVRKSLFVNSRNGINNWSTFNQILRFPCIIWVLDVMIGMISTVANIWFSLCMKSGVWISSFSF